MNEDLEITVKQWACDHHYDADAIKVYGRGCPRVVIIGETHNIHLLKDQQVDLCARLNSDTLAHEMLANTIYDVERRILYRNPLYQVHDAHIKYVTQTQELNREVLDRGLATDILKEFSRYGYKEFEEWKSKNNITLNLDVFEQDKMCDFFDPVRINVGYTLSHLPLGIKKIIGCDIDSAANRYLIAKYQEQGLLASYKYDDADLAQIPEYYEVRERRMARVILDLVSKTQMPLFVVVGANHIRERRDPSRRYEEWPSRLDSWIHQVIPGNGFSYITIDQTKSRTHHDWVRVWKERRER